MDQTSFDKQRAQTSVSIMSGEEKQSRTVQQSKRNSLIEPPHHKKRLSQNMKAVKFLTTVRPKSQLSSHHKNTSKSKQSNKNQKGSAQSKSRRSTADYTSINGGKTWTGLTTQEIINAKKFRQRKSLLAQGLLDNQPQYHNQVEIHKQEKIEHYDLEYERVQQKEKHVPMDKNSVYIPDFIEDEKVKKTFYWTTDSEKKRIEEEDNRKKEEIAKMDFTFQELQDLDMHTKDEYMRRILNEDAQISQYIKSVCEIVENTEDQLVDVEYEIDNIKEDWDREMQEINERLYNNAVNNGITRKEFKFVAFKIKDFDKDYQKDKDEQKADLIKKYAEQGTYKKVEVDAKGNVVQIQDFITRKHENKKQVMKKAKQAEAKT